MVGASRQPAQPWQQPAQPGLHHCPGAPPIAPSDKGLLGGGRAAWGAPSPGAGRCPPRADRQPPVLPEGHGEPLRILRRHHVTEDRMSSSGRPCGGGRGSCCPPRRRCIWSLCGLVLAVAVRGQAAFHAHQGPCCGVWARQSGGRLGGGRPGPPYLASAASLSWSEQPCPRGPGGACAQAGLTCPRGVGLRDPRVPTALHTGPRPN